MRYLFNFDNIADKQKLFAMLKELKGNQLIEIIGNQRTPEDNKYYYGVLLRDASFHSGYSAEELHDIYSKKHLAFLHNKQTKGSTAMLSENEFKDYLDFFRAEIFNDLKISLEI